MRLAATTKQRLLAPPNPAINPTNPAPPRKMSLLTPLPQNDSIYLSSLSLTAIIAPGDAWSRALKPTPVLLSLRVLLAHNHLSLPARTDNVADTISYGVLAKHVSAAITDHAAYASLKAFAIHVGEAALQLGGEGVEVRALLPEALLLGEGAAVEYDGLTGEAVLLLRRVRIACVVGVNAHEREQKQWVVFDIRMRGVGETVWTGYPEAARRVVEVCGPPWEEGACADCVCRWSRFRGILQLRAWRLRLRRCF